MITDYHSQLFANELTLRAPMGTIERIAAALMGSRIDLNPHQVCSTELSINVHHCNDVYSWALLFYFTGKSS